MKKKFMILGLLVLTVCSLDTRVSSRWRFTHNIVNNSGQDVRIVLYFMFSNESFFRASFGIEQYYHHIKSQAIAFRKAVARSSNKGYSTVINCKGEIKALKKYSDKGFIKTSFNVNNYQTFYSRYGDFIGYLSLIYLLISILNDFLEKRYSKNGCQ